MSQTKQTSKAQELLLLMESITIYRNLLQRQPLLTFRHLLEELCAPECDPIRVIRKYHELCASLAMSSWKGEILNLILMDENVFTNSISQNAEPLIWEKLVKRDLDLLGMIANLSAEDLKQIIAELLAAKLDDTLTTFGDVLHISNWPEWPDDQDTFQPSPVLKSKSLAWLNRERSQLINHFSSLTSWGLGFDALTRYYQVVGAGIFSSYTAFRWVGEEGCLEGINNPDSISITDLIGQAREQKIVLENTEHFINGYPANNVILYGDRGTGKSSLVKALLNEYAPKGLRLIELRKADLGDYLKIIKIVKDKPQKFIIFIDDLSFTDKEQEYKTLKTLLEGGIEARPANVLIYATSNRRHLIKESFADRQTADVHSRDNQQEILSLADRFGITVTFPAPDQEGYLKIVEGLAEQHGLTIQRELLRQQALRWSMFHNGYSGRTARQFIDHLIAVEASKK